jgi:Glycosyl hydrolases family 16
MTITMMLVGAVAGLAYYAYPDAGARPAAAKLQVGFYQGHSARGVLGRGQANPDYSDPAPLVTATAADPRTQGPAHRHHPGPTPTPRSSPPTATPTATAPTAPPTAPGGGGGGGGSTAAPVAGASYAGSLVFNATGSQLESWNQTSSFCPNQPPGFVGDGKVATDGSGNVTLTTTGSPGSCAGLISPQAVSSGVVEADIDFPALPGKPDTIANWTGLWMTDAATWPTDGEIDATESEPVNGVDAVSWHSGTQSQQFVASTDDFFPAQLPRQSANLTPGWHTVDIAYTKGFFAVYYDGQQYTSFTSDNVTGSALNIYLSMAVTQDSSAAQQMVGGNPVNSDSSPATLAVKYVRAWSFK